MLRNFIKTSDLKKYYPTLDTNLWKNVGDYALQIEQAFERVNSDLWTKGIDPRKIMLPVAINDSVGTLVPSSFKRLAFVSTVDGQLTLLGSQDNLTFTTVKVIDTCEMTDTIIEDTYKYYKYSSTGTMTSVEFYETAFDRVIIFASFALIFRDFMKEVDDVWDIKRKLAEQDYIDTITSLKYYLDANDNQIVDDNELTNSLTITMVR